MATADKPLILFLDSLDQLSNEDFGRSLKWLPLKDELPAHCHIVVSTLPDQCLDIVDSFIPGDNLLEVFIFILSVFFTYMSLLFSLLGSSKN